MTKTTKGRSLLFFGGFLIIMLALIASGCDNGNGVDSPYKIKYDANGGTSPPSDSTFSLAQLATGTVKSGGSMTRAGHRFTGWNTQADGGGTNIGGGAALSTAIVTAVKAASDKTITLYAKWTAITYTITYNAGNGGGTPPAAQTVSYTDRATATAAAKTGLTAPASETTFKWTNQPGGAAGGTEIDESASLESVLNADATSNQTITLYARWT